MKEVPLRWLFLALILSGFGLVALYSIAADAGELISSSRFFKHLLWLIPSFGVFVFFLGIPVRLVHKYAYLSLGVVLVLLFLPYATGSVAETYRWISFKGISFQPSEIMKWVMVIALARYLSDHNLKIKKIRSLIIPIIVVLIPAAIIIKQPDLGSAMIIITPIIPLLFF